MKTAEIMSRAVTTVSPDETILHAARLMLQKGFSGMPVVDSAGSLIGIVTEGDFLRRSETETIRRRPRWLEFLIGVGPIAGEYVRAAGHHVKDVMTSDVYTVEEDTELQEVVDLMERHHIKRVPVVHENKVVGIITRQNLLRALVKSSAKPSATYDDDAIKRQIETELANQSWAPLLNLSVTNGHVKLSGTIFDDRQREALRILLEKVPGVNGIEDQLVFIEPMSGMVIESPKETAAQTRAA
jgi:CBS-domain-containing membrane protein